MFPLSAYRWLSVTAVIGWAAAVGLGLWLVYAYDAVPGERRTPPRMWPAGSSIQRNASSACLVMFVHPNCPCSRVSVLELNRFLARSEGLIAAQVWYLRPRGVTNAWDEAAFVREAQSIPGVEVHRDEDGDEARRFGVATSGHALLYDANGRLLFSGGLTPMRGHPGDEASLRAIIDLLHFPPDAVVEAPVFGCPLFEPGNRAWQETCPCPE